MAKKKKSLLASKAKAKAAKMGGGYENTLIKLPDGVKQFQIKSDKTILIDILPFKAGKHNRNSEAGEYWYETTYFMHRGIGAEEQAFVCPSKQRGAKCPICEFRAKLTADGGDEDHIKQLAPKQRQLFNVIDTKNRDAGVQVWDMSYHLFGKLLAKRIEDSDEDDGYENFAELEGGFTLKCGVEEKSLYGITFYEIVSIDFKPRKEDYDEDILEEVHCLDDLIIVNDYDTLKSKLLETDVDEDEEKPKKSKGKDKPKAKAKDEDEGEEEDEEEEEDEGEEEKGIDKMDRDDLEEVIDDKELDLDIDDFKDNKVGLKKLRKAVQEAIDAKENEDEDEDEASQADPEEMDRDELEELIDDKELDVDIDDFKDNKIGLKKLRKAVAKALESNEKEKEDEDEEEEDEEDEDEEKPKKSKGKAKGKKAKEDEDEDEDDEGEGEDDEGEGEDDWD